MYVKKIYLFITNRFFYKFDNKVWNEYQTRVFLLTSQFINLYFFENMFPLICDISRYTNSNINNLLRIHTNYSYNVVMGVNRQLTF